MPTTYRYAVTIHDVGNICDDPRNVHSILTSTDRIAPRERVEVVAMPTGPTELLASVAAQLGELDYSTPTPQRDALGDALRGRTWTLPRGVTFTANPHAGVVYVETKSASYWTGETREDRRSQTNVTVYGIVTRGGKESSGSVEIWHGNRYTDDGEHGTPEARAYWRNLTGANVPDGARENVAAAVLADVREVMGADDAPSWVTIGDEADEARHCADTRRYVGEAIRAVEQAARMIAGKADR